MNNDLRSVANEKRRLDELFRNYAEVPNDKVLWRLIRSASRVLEKGFPLTKEFLPLPDQLTATTIVMNCYERVLDVLNNCDIFLEKMPEHFVESWEILEDQISNIREVAVPLFSRVQYLREMIYGETVSGEPMSHEAMMEFLGSLKPDVEEPHPVSFHSTPHEKPNMFYQPAGPLGPGVELHNEVQQVPFNADNKPQVTGNEIDTPIQMTHDAGDLPSVDPEPAD